jgi:hypothetical protein
MVGNRVFTLSEGLYSNIFSMNDKWTNLLIC